MNVLSVPREARILVVRLKSLGDILLSLPLVIELKRRRPDLVFDYLIDSRFAGAAALSDAVRREVMRPEGWMDRMAVVMTLSRKYDMALDLHGSPFAALAARIAGRDVVVGHDGKRFSGLYSHRIPRARGDFHTIEANLLVLRLFGIDPPSNFSWNLEPDTEEGARLRDDHGGFDTLIHPGGRFPHKLWPSEKFSELAATLVARGRRIAVLTGPGDPPLPEGLAVYPRLSNLSPRKLLAAVAAARLFIGNDSGPMHYAAAVGTPTVGLFGPSDVRRWSPYGARTAVVSVECSCGAGSQRPCRTPDRWCMRRITTEDVISAIEVAARDDV